MPSLRRKDGRRAEGNAGDDAGRRVHGGDRGVARTERDDAPGEDVAARVTHVALAVVVLPTWIVGEPNVTLTDATGATVTVIAAWPLTPSAVAMMFALPAPAPSHHARRGVDRRDRRVARTPGDRAAREDVVERVTRGRGRGGRRADLDRRGAQRHAHRRNRDATRDGDRCLPGDALAGGEDGRRTRRMPVTTPVEAIHGRDRRVARS